MILSDIRSYLRQHGRAAVQDLAVHFHSDADAIRGMLGEWEKRGKVRRLPSGTACAGGCNKCDPASVEIYEWCG
jgi:putative ferrous iron transport protein C